MQPVRHALGALLLEQGDQSNLHEAEAVFRADLGLPYGCEGGGSSGSGGSNYKLLPKCKAHPRNVWALRGLCDALAAQAKHDERVVFAGQLAEAEGDADVVVGAACACACSSDRHRTKPMGPTVDGKTRSLSSRAVAPTGSEPHHSMFTVAVGVAALAMLSGFLLRNSSN
jgi:hypothetical protein